MELQDLSKEERELKKKTENILQWNPTLTKSLRYIMNDIIQPSYNQMYGKKNPF